MLFTENRIFKPYPYFATPDGEDLVAKLSHVMKAATVVSLGTATVDVVLYSKPKGYLNTIGRYIYISYPLISSAAAFVVISNLSGNLRHKNDPWNWFWGGAVSGSVIGIWRKSGIGGCFAALALGSFAAIVKDCKARGYDFNPPVVQNRGDLWLSRHDWTLTKHRPGNWTTGEK